MPGRLRGHPGLQQRAHLRDAQHRRRATSTRATRSPTCTPAGRSPTPPTGRRWPTRSAPACRSPPRATGPTPGGTSTTATRATTRSTQAKAAEEIERYKQDTGADNLSFTLSGLPGSRTPGSCRSSSSSGAMPASTPHRPDRPGQVHLDHRARRVPGRLVPVVRQPRPRRQLRVQRRGDGGRRRWREHQLHRVHVAGDAGEPPDRAVASTDFKTRKAANDKVIKEINEQA